MTSVPAGQPQFDVVVLGTGAAGLVAAVAAAERGASVGLFEKAEPRRRHDGYLRRGMLGSVQRTDGRQRDR